jgi:Uncharacterized conserved protein
VIQVSEVAPDKAALAIADVLDSEGGRWLVNAVEDEGFVMARVGTLEGKRLERSGSPNLAGPFGTLWRISYIAADLAAAQKAGQRVRVITPRIRAPKSRYELIERIVALLGVRQRAASDLAQATGTSVDTVRKALRRLKQSGEVVSYRNRDATYVYALAMCKGMAA